MHQNLQRLPAERVRHRNLKRLPFQGWPDTVPLARQIEGSLANGPITITQIIPINTNTNTVNTATTSTTPVVLPINTPSSPSVTPSLPTDTNTPSSPSPPAAPINSLTRAPSPSASAIPPSNSSSSGGMEGALNGPVSAVSQPHGLPTGAVVGITIACVMLILGAFIFFIRQRAVRNRKLRRATSPWMAAPRPTNPFEPATYPAGPSGNMGETTPGASFARVQPPVPVPVPSMPAPMPSSYNNPVPAAVPAGAGVPAAVRYEFIPSLPDELSITTGEVVRMLSEYDDGWALCKNGRGEQGMVPLECLDRGSAPAQALQVEQQDPRNLRRTSSLRAGY
ncbi:hypothetical protein B0H19DRAFT_470393 [Mycena capillaripes]|nr:hypothetical protein B0H19DRAFT_470393 [Mycena capillaripes]